MKLTFAAILLASLAMTGCAGPSNTTTSQPALTGLTLTFTGPLTVAVGTQAQYASTVVGSTNQAVTWQVNGVAGGSATTGVISAAGLYTAPSTIPANPVVSITAVSVANPAASTSANVTINYAMPVIASATGSTTTYGQTFLLDVQGTGFTTGATLLVNGSAVSTCAVSANDLQAIVPNGTGSSLQVSVAVQNPSPSAFTSAAVPVALNLPAAPTTQNQWMTQVSQQNISPACPAAGDSQLSWTAPDGRTIQLVVKSPAPAASAAPYTMPAVPAGVDARPYFDAAVKQARTQKASKLLIPKATYTFNTVAADGSGHLELENLSDITVDGQGSTLIFTQAAHNGIFVSTSQRLKITNFVIQYQLANPMTFIGTISSTTPYTLTANAGYTIGSTDTLGHISQYDPSTSTFVFNGPSLYIPTITYNGAGGWTSPQFSSAMAGKSFMVYEQYYGGAGLEIEDTYGPSQSEDVILDTLTINSGPGMGIVAYGLKRGLGIWNTQVTPAAGSLISTEYDGIHMLIVGGDVYMHDNLIANEGDDAINLNNPIMPIVTYAGGTSVELSTYSRFIQQYDQLSFFDANNNLLGTAQVTSPLLSLGGPNNQYNSMNLSNAITGTPTLVRDMNLVDQRVAVVNNTIQNCQCRGMLVQVPNVLVQGNTLNRTLSDPIQLETDIGNFFEGTGAINVLVQNNTINAAGYPTDINNDASTYGAIFAFNSNIHGITSTISNEYINIIGNTINNVNNECVIVASSQFVNVTSNTCNSANLVTTGAPSITVEDANTVSVEQNVRSGGTTGGISVSSSTTTGVTYQNNY